MFVASNKNIYLCISFKRNEKPPRGQIQEVLNSLVLTDGYDNERIDNTKIRINFLKDN